MMRHHATRRRQARLAATRGRRAGGEAAARVGPEPLEPRLALSVAPGLVETGSQPAGALAGKIVYTSAGHGWQWNNTLDRWATDRPNLLSMVEDFGNQDQLTPYVDHLFRAGATVVPMRPVGRQLNEVVVDNDSPDVSWSGTWSNSTSGARWYDEDYGAVADTVRYRFANVSAAGQTAVATYAPTIPAAGDYPVYAWASHGSNRTTQRYVVNHTGGRTEVSVDHRKVGNGWVYLGTYHFDAGRSAADGSVEVGNFSTAGGSVVIADAIRFGNGMGDLRWGAGGIGTGDISGYPREDEGSIAWCWRGIGLSTSFSSPSAILGTDNVSAPIRMAEEMNADGTAYGTSVYVGFHSNATTGNPATATGRGALGLVHSSSPTPNQAGLATRLGRQINVDMRALDGQFAHSWSTRTAYSLTGSYGEISNARAAGEFDATIIEVAFHDNTEDAALLRDPRVRDQIARSTYEGTLEHLIDFPGTTATPADVTTPAVPLRVQAVSTAPGEVTVSWLPGPSSAGGVDGVHGSPATGFRVFASVDGRGFDGGTAVAGGGARSVTLRGLDPSRPYFFRACAENAGGRSDVSEVVAATPTGGPRQVLVVDGFDRLDSSRNFRQAYAYGGGGVTDRVWAAFNNPRNGVVPVVAAIQAARPGVRIDAASNEAVASGAVPLIGYAAVVWILGNESTAGRTFDAAEQALVEAYVAAGGDLLVTGSELGWDLDAQNNGRTFLRSSLGASYVADVAGTFTVSAAAGGLFAGLSQFTFSDGTAFSSLDGQSAGVSSADVLAALTGARPALAYVGGAGGLAAVEKPATGGRGGTVVFGFPFESIVQATARTAVMDRVLGSFGIEAPVTDVVVSVPAGSTVTETTSRTGRVRLVKRGAGTLVLDAANTHAGGILVEEGGLAIRNPAAVGSGGLEVRGGAAVRLETDSAPVPLATLALDPQARFDVGTGRLVVAGGFDAVAVRQALIAGRNGGDWDGPVGIGSRSALLGSNRAVGYRVAAGSLTIAWAAFGDVNLDGQVNQTDLNLVSVAGRFGQGPASGAVWAEGDFNYSGGVTQADMNLLSNSALFGTGSYLPQQVLAWPSAIGNDATSAPIGSTPSSRKRVATPPAQ